MAHFAHTTSIIASLLLLLLLLLPHSYSSDEADLDDDYDFESSPVPLSDVDLLEFPLNLEYLEAEFFLYGSLGFGLDTVAPNLTMGGPKPIGVKKAKLDPFTRDVIEQFAWQEVGHLRAIKRTVRGFPRPQLDLSAKSFAKGNGVLDVHMHHDESAERRIMVTLKILRRLKQQEEESRRRIELKKEESFKKHWSIRDTLRRKLSRSKLERVAEKLQDVNLGALCQ